MHEQAPAEWTPTPLKQCGKWLSGGTPRRSNSAYWDGSIPWISAKSIHDFFLESSPENVTELGAKNGTKIVPEGSLLMVVRGMSLDKEFRVGIATRPLAFNQDLKAVIPDRDLIDPLYLGYYLQGAEHQVLQMVSRSSHGTCKLDTGRLLSLPILRPSLGVQKKIAAILSSVDEAIQATQAVIDQTRRVKEGLLQDLLTRGIGHDERRDTKLGKLPSHWEPRQLDKVCRKEITYGIVQCGPHIEDGVPYIRVSDMEQRVLTEKGMLRTSSDIASKYERSTVQTGDIVYALRGDIGKVRMVPPSLAGANLTQDTARLSPGDATMPKYLLWVMRGPQALRQAQMRAKGSTFQEITLGDLQQIHVPIPPKDEQASIVERLESCEQTQRRNQAIRDNLERSKAGLLQDLLTGKVRVSTCWAAVGQHPSGGSRTSTNKG